MSSDWQLCTFGNLVSFVSEKAKAETSNIQTYISTENMESNFGGVKLAAAIPSSGSVTKFHVTDTLFSNIRTYFKKVWQAGFDGTCSNDVLVLRSRDKTKFLPDYLHNLCRWEKFTEFSVRTSKGAKMPRGDKDALVKFQFELPPIDEQREICKILGSLDQRVSVLRETNATLEAIAQALFKSWFVDFDPVRAKIESRAPEGMDEETAAIFPDAFEESELGLVPNGWGVSTVGEMLKTVLGGTPSRKVAEYWLEGTIPWINSGKVNEFRIYEPSELITEEALRRSATKLLPKRTTVIAITGATLGQVSLTEIECCANQSVVGIIETDEICSEYIYHWIKSNISKLLSTQTGAAQQHVNKGNVDELGILIPSRDVLKRYLEISRPIFDSIQNNGVEQISLARLRDILLPRLISGQLRVSEAEELFATATQ